MMPCEALAAGCLAAQGKQRRARKPLQSVDKLLLRVWTPKGRARCGGFSMRRSRNEEVRGFTFNVLLPDSLPQESLLFIPVLRSFAMWRWL